MKARCHGGKEETAESSTANTITLTCHDARNGREIFGKERFSERCSFTASPWACNGKLFFLSEDGDTYVAEAGTEFKVLHKNPLEELTLASPAISQGNLLIRTASKLYCIARKP